MKARSHSHERGSALLIVFVFAAIVAISLYMEMPVAAFEAQRQKEQLLISRGNEYAHAVKLFVRKTGHYPASLKDLEDTNRMRFLRHQYKDPFTGKNDWRLLHAGPNGAIIDSKVKGGMILPGMSPGQANQNAPTPTSTTSFGGNSSFGSNANGAFGNDSFAKPPQTAGSDASADTTPPEMTVQQPRQRPPAVSANGETGAGSPADASADASLAVPPATQGSNAPPQQTQNGLPVPNAAQPGASPTAGAQSTDQSGATPDLKSQMLSGSGGSRFGQGNAAGGFGSSSQMGVVQSGGIAGVASKAGGHSIKLVNDQDDYSKWEFFYDPTKNTTPGGVQMGAFNQQQNAQQQTGFGTQSGAQTQTGGLGTQNSAAGQNATSQSSSFGQGGGFGQGSFAQGSTGSSQTNNPPAQNSAGSTSTNPNPSQTPQ
ncbi:MAG TPA: hypothetical protein VKX25_05155 [Bryobacteraceae bacterium]|jgi:hypothetical protein|nr:hypothetical protein [Bryobacteraceae bacterium]